jgi:hypothetical protein
MTTSFAAAIAPRMVRTPRVTPALRRTAIFVTAGAGVVAAAVVVPAFVQAALLLAGPAALLVLVSRAGADDELDADTLRTMLGIPPTLD